jgi:hypothetical protein
MQPTRGRNEPAALVKLTTKKAAFPPVISPRSARSPFCTDLVATAAGTRASAAHARAPSAPPRPPSTDETPQATPDAEQRTNTSR